MGCEESRDNGVGEVLNTQVDTDPPLLDSAAIYGADRALVTTHTGFTVSMDAAEAGPSTLRPTQGYSAVK